MEIAFVTPSYRGDYERCRLLCESTTRFLPEGIEHILIVDKRDVPLFRQLENRTVRVVVGESLMPWWIFRLPGFNRGWISLAGLPVRNWIYQQMLKISAVYATEADIIQFVDSDVTLVRPFPVDYLFRGDRIRMQRVDYQSSEHTKWLQVAARLLDVQDEISTKYNYVGSFITWSRANVLGMIDRIEEVGRSSALMTISRQRGFSEYMTYGTYVDYVVGLEGSGHYYDNSPNLHLCWNYNVQTNEGMNEFFSDIKPEHFGIMIHSKYDIPVQNYRDQIKALWDKWA